MTIQQGNAGIYSDDFSDVSASNTLWDTTTRINGGSVSFQGAGTADATCTVSVPAGSPHDAWVDDQACQVLQPTNGAAFDIQAKFQGTAPSIQFQERGLIVRDDTTTSFLRYDNFSADATDVGDFYFFSAMLDPGVTGKNPLQSAAFPQQSDVWMRIIWDPTGDGGNGSMQLYFSFDLPNLGWTLWRTIDYSTVQPTCQVFPTHVGFFGGNEGSNPAYDATIDWFMEASATIDPEDDLNTPTPTRMTVIS